MDDNKYIITKEIIMRHGHPVEFERVQLANPKGSKRNLEKCESCPELIYYMEDTKRKPYRYAKLCNYTGLLPEETETCEYWD